MSEAVKCLGSECTYFRQYYVPMKYQGGWQPNFALQPDKYCAHPTMLPESKSVDVTQGRNIQQIRICPLK